MGLLFQRKIPSPRFSFGSCPKAPASPPVLFANEYQKPPVLPRFSSQMPPVLPRFFLGAPGSPYTLCQPRKMSSKCLFELMSQDHSFIFEDFPFLRGCQAPCALSSVPFFFSKKLQGQRKRMKCVKHCLFAIADGSVSFAASRCCSTICLPSRERRGMTAPHSLTH